MVPRAEGVAEKGEAVALAGLGGAAARGVMEKA